MFFANSSFLAVKRKCGLAYNTKNVKPVMSLVSHSEGLRIALFVETKVQDTPLL